MEPTQGAQDETALEAMRRHSWPGNVRELLHRCGSRGGGVRKAARFWQSTFRFFGLSAARCRRLPGGARAEMAELPTLGGAGIDGTSERALEASNGHRGNAARILGISERNLYRKLKEYRMWARFPTAPCSRGSVV